MIKTIVKENHGYKLELKEKLTIDGLVNLIEKALQDYILENGLDSKVQVIDSSCYQYGADKGIMVVARNYNPVTQSSLKPWYSEATIAYDVRGSETDPARAVQNYNILACKELPNAGLPKLLKSLW